MGFCLPSEVAEASNFPLIVSGHVQDIQGGPIDGATVTAEIRYSLTGDSRASLTHVTSTEGFYSITFAPEQWDVGNVAVVTAQYADDFGSNYTALSSAESDWYVNITYPLKLAPQAPVMVFDVWKHYLTVDVDASASLDPDGMIVSCNWDFGDGATASGFVATHTYAAGGTYTITLTLMDNDGLTSVHTRDVTVAPMMTFTLNLVRGWNLVSIPLVNHGYKASTLGLLPGDVVTGWDPVTQGYTRSFIIGVSPSMFDFDILPGYGYWAYAGDARSLALEGEAPSAPVTRALGLLPSGGWALIGLVSVGTGMMASDVPLMYSGSVMTVVAYSASGYRPYIVGGPLTDFALVLGKGYWIWCVGDGVLTVYPPPAA